MSAVKRLLCSVLLLLALVSVQSAPVLADPPYIPPGPPNDDFADAQHLVLNKRFKTAENIGGASLEPAELTDPDLLACDMYYSVWYSFTAPFDGVLTFSTAGSKAYYSPYHYTTDTKLGIYVGTTLADLVQVACADNFNGTVMAAIPAFDVREGYTYYVRVGLYSDEMPLWGWLKVIATVLSAANYDPGDFQNLDFSAPLGPSNWTLTKAKNGDGQICDPTCKVKFVGGPNEATTLKQKRTWPVDVLLAREEHMLEMAVFVQSTPDADFKIQLAVTYSDGTPATKETIFVINEVYTFVTAGLFFQSPNVASVKAIFRNREETGSVLIGNIMFDYDGALARDAVLPLPPLSNFTR